MRDKAMQIQLVVNVKLVFLIFMMFCRGAAFSQNIKTIRINSESFKSPNYTLTNYNLDMKPLYSRDLQVITYNVIFAENENNYERIVLISILPDYDTGEQWSEVDTLNEKFQEVSPTDLQSLFVSNVGYVNENMTNIERKYFNKYHVIVENNGKLYKSNNCLLELFDIKSVDPIIPSTYGQLNLKDSTLRISEYLDFFSKYYPNYNPALSGYIDNSKKLNYREWWRFWKDYLSSTLRINNDIGYKFWTTSFNNSNHNPDFSRGVERLIYMPGKGIVAGSYDFYFKPLFETNGDGDIFNNLFFKNMVEEKVALASELSF